MWRRALTLKTTFSSKNLSTRARKTPQSWLRQKLRIWNRIPTERFIIESFSPRRCCFQSATIGKTFKQQSSWFRFHDITIKTRKAQMILEPHKMPFGWHKSGAKKKNACKRSDELVGKSNKCARMENKRKTVSGIQQTTLAQIYS